MDDRIAEAIAVAKPRQRPILDDLGGFERRVLGAMVAVIHRDVPGVAGVAVDRQHIPGRPRGEHLAPVLLVET